MARGLTLQRWQLAVPLSLFFCLFVLAPLGLLAAVSVTGPDGLTTAQYVKFLTDGFNLTILRDTLVLGLEATVLALLLGYPLAYGFVQASARLQRVLIFLIVLPLLTSAVVRTFAWVIILGRQGIINEAVQWLGLTPDPLRLLYTEPAVVVALAQIELPLMTLPLITAIGAIDPNLPQASAALGAGHWRTFFKIIVPLSLPGMLGGCLLVFAAATSAFITQSIIGGGRLMYLPLYIYQQAIQVQDWPFAATIAMILLAAVLGIVFAMNAVGRLGRGYAHG
jgi:putative spermidine/putrescine transport system permease protein